MVERTEQRLVVFDTTPEEARGWPLKRYAAAGGVVVRGGRALLLRRTIEGTPEVRLPKGRVEEGESLEEAALREVREESGLPRPVVVARLGTVESRFAYGGRRFERRETYFLMTSEDAAGGPPEPDYDWELDWCPIDEAEGKVSYPSEKRALRWAAAHTRC